MKQQKSWFIEHPIWIGVIGIIALLFVSMLLGNYISKNYILTEEELKEQETAIPLEDKPTELEIQIVEEFEEVLYLELSKLFDKYDKEYQGDWIEEVILKEAEEGDVLEDKIIEEFAIKYNMTSEEFIKIIIKVNAYKYK